MKERDHYRQILSLVHKIGRLVNPQHLEPLRERKISLSQFLVLDSLAASEDSLRMTDLALLSGLSAAELSRVVKSLEERGWLLRTTDDEDSRAQLLRLSAEGGRVIRRISSDATSELSAVWEDFTHDEWHQFIDYLARFERGVRRVRIGGPSQTSKPKRKEKGRSK
jgi:DNA-binding MarR family transcriptional regulator